MKRHLIAFGLTAAMAMAADSGVRVWTNAELKGFEKKLAPTAAAAPEKIASENFGNLGNNAKAQIGHREDDGIAELHEMVADGEATLVTGGEVANAKQTAVNEIRGTMVKGGEKKKISAGDIIYIPAKTPHQLLVEKGKQFTYFVVKVTK